MRINHGKLRSIILEAMLNAYSVLGVPPNASEDEIKRAWRALAVQNHPDRGGSHGKMVDINMAKDRLLDKTALYRYGPTFKGYDDSGTPKAPVMSRCSKCGRNVAVKDGKLVGHYTEQGGNVKCEGSFKAPAAAAASSTPPNDYYRNAEGDFWDFFRRRSQERPERPEDWQQSNDPDYEYNYRTGAYRRKNDAQQQARQDAEDREYRQQRASNYKYYTYTRGTSNKFWAYEIVGNTLYTRWGRIGSTGQTNSKTYRSSWDARGEAARLQMSKINKGYTPATPPNNVPRPSQTTAGSAAPGPQRPRPAPTGRPTKDTYKVYPWKNSRRVVRVGGKLYGTGVGGTLSTGGTSRFNANDRVKVSLDNGRMKVSNDAGSHSQTWDPIAQADNVDEVRKIVDELVIEMIARIGEGNS